MDASIKERDLLYERAEKIDDALTHIGSGLKQSIDSVNQSVSHDLSTPLGKVSS